MSLDSWKKEFYPTPAQDNCGDPLTAAKHSLKKWEGLTPDSLSAHNVSRDGYYITDGSDSLVIEEATCALCSYQDSLDKEKGYTSWCSGCPLVEFAGAMCNITYPRFIDHGNAKPMIAALRKCVKKLEKEAKGKGT